MMAGWLNNLAAKHTVVVYLVIHYASKMLAFWLMAEAKALMAPK